jgi:hypothetical protein
MRRQASQAATADGHPRRPAILVAAATLAAMSLACTGSATADPLLLPPLPGHADRGATIEVVAPPAARVCAARFVRRGHASRLYRVTLGGPTRTAKWTIDRRARGRWIARVSCGTSMARPATLGSAARPVRATRRGGGSSRFVQPGSFRAGPGTIPEQPPTPAPEARREVRAAQSVDTSGWSSCASPWMTRAHVAGTGVATTISFAPTTKARVEGRLQRSNYEAMWGDLQRCVRFPPMSGSQLHSVYEQMACHIRYGVVPLLGGPTWDFEAWRNDVPWNRVMDLGGRCGQGWGDVPAAGGAFVGRIIQSSDDTSSQKAAWLVDNQNGILVRRHIPTTRIYGCLKAAGRPGPDALPGEFLNEYLPTLGADMTDAACPADTSPPPQGPSPPPAGNPPPPAFYTFHVTGTCRDGACGLRVRTGPGYSSYPYTRVVYDGNAVDIVCQTLGETVSNGYASSAVWDRLTDGGYVSDFYIDTPNIGTWSPPIPRC